MGAVMSGGALRVGTVRGIELRLHISWLLAVGFMTWSLARGWFPQFYPGWSEATYYLVGGFAATLLFGSVLLHEFGHAFTALRLGIPVRSITLFIFGGVAELKRDADSPRAEFWVAVMGPVVSAVLAAGCWLLRPVAGALGEQVLAVVSYLALLNGVLLVFNLIPGFPLDGGRILRAILWGATKDFRRATSIAVAIGQGIAFLLIGWGLYRLIGGDLLGGIWTAFTGWFLSNAATTAGRQAAIQEELAGIRVAEVMQRQPSIVPSTITLAQLVNDHMLPGSRRAHLVAADGRLVGLVTLTDLLRQGRGAWDTLTVGEVMTPFERLVTTTPATPLTTALQQLGEGDFHQLPVLDGGYPVGFLTRAGLVQYLQLRSQLDALGAVVPPDEASRAHRGPSPALIESRR
jgi:Zn-dependent protease/predicted transcriptional regulator